MTLDDLRKSSDPLADLLAMSDNDLDRVAAEAHGWETVVMGYWEKDERTFRWYNGDVPCMQGKDGYYNTPSAVKWSEHFEKAGQYLIGTYLAKLNDDGELDCMAEECYEPSRNLNQAYRLLDSGDRQNRYVWACDVDGDGRYVELISQRLGVVQVYFEQAGSHARAVCVLAILGLLQSGKDGAA